MGPALPRRGEEEEEPQGLVMRGRRKEGWEGKASVETELS